MMIEPDALKLLVGAATFDELIEVVLAFNFASLNTDEVLNLLTLVDYIGAELRTAHHHTLHAFWRDQLPGQSEQTHDLDDSTRLTPTCFSEPPRRSSSPRAFRLSPSGSDSSGSDFTGHTL